MKSRGQLVLRQISFFEYLANEQLKTGRDVTSKTKLSMTTFVALYSTISLAVIIQNMNCYKNVKIKNILLMMYVPS